MPGQLQALSNTSSVDIQHKAGKVSGQAGSWHQSKGAAGVVAVPAGGVEGTGILLPGQESLGDLILLY